MTAAITCFKVGTRKPQATMRAVASIDDLGALDRGRRIARHELACARKWSALARGPQSVPAGFIELGELFRVHRGQVTGANDVWIESEAARELPDRYKPFRGDERARAVCRRSGAQFD